MEKEIEEKLSTPDSWIPIKAIKKLIGIKELPKTIESNGSLKCSFAKEENIKELNDKPPIESLPINFKRSSSRVFHSPNLYSNNFSSSAENKIKALKRENSHLRQKLKISEDRNKELSEALASLRTEHMIKLQTLQEQHERKIFKTKKDLDYLLKELNQRSSQEMLCNFMKFHVSELSKCHQNYKEIINSILENHEKNDHISIISQSVEKKLGSDLVDLKEKYENSLETLKNLVTSETLDTCFEDEVSTNLNSERETLLKSHSTDRFECEKRESTGY